MKWRVAYSGGADDERQLKNMICIKNHDDLSSQILWELYCFIVNIVSPQLALPACCKSKSTPPGWLVAKSVRLATKPSTAIHRSPWFEATETYRNSTCSALPTWWLRPNRAFCFLSPTPGNQLHYIFPYGQRNFNIQSHSMCLTHGSVMFRQQRVTTQTLSIAIR